VSVVNTSSASTIDWNAPVTAVDKFFDKADVYEHKKSWRPTGTGEGKKSRRRHKSKK